MVTIQNQLEVFTFMGFLELIIIVGIMGLFIFVPVIVLIIILMTRKKGGNEIEALRAQVYQLEQRLRYLESQQATGSTQPRKE
jgi:hypothetical protein